jgi:hypothetical protein
MTTQHGATVRIPRVEYRVTAIALLFILAVPAFMAISESIQRINAHLTGRNVNIPVRLDGDPVTIVSDRGPVLDSVVTKATLHVPTLPEEVRAAFIAQHLLTILAVLTLAVCLVILVRSIARGQLFSARNTGLTATMTGAAIVLATVVPILGTVVSRAIVEPLDMGFMQPTANWFPAIAVAAIAGGGLLFQWFFRVGHGLARDSEGLV